MKKVTINEIAKMARVSKGTVSKILNDKPGIGEDTRRRVLELVNHLDYTPNSSAQALAFNRTSNIGLIVPHEAGVSLNGSYWSSLITAIAKRANTSKYNLMLFTPKTEGHLEEVYDSVLRSRKVDGLIIGSELVDKKSISRLLIADLPFVFVGQNADFPHFSVDVDNRAAATEMTRYIFDHGYSRPVFLSGPQDYFYNRERTAGFIDAVGPAAADGRTAAVPAYDSPFIFEAVDHLFRNSPDLDSIFVGAGGDFLFDVLTRLRRHRTDFSAVGICVFDDYRYLDFVEPRVTAVRQPLEEIGSHATAMLLKLIEKQPPESRVVILPTDIHPRGSLRD